MASFSIIMAGPRKAHLPSCLAAGSNGISAGECFSLPCFPLFPRFPSCFSSLFLSLIQHSKEGLSPVHRFSFVYEDRCTYCTYRYRTFYLESGIKIEETRTKRAPPTCHSFLPSIPLVGRVFGYPYLPSCPPRVAHMNPRPPIWPHSMHAPLA